MTFAPSSFDSNTIDVGLDGPVRTPDYEGVGRVGSLRGFISEDAPPILVFARGAVSSGVSLGGTTENISPRIGLVAILLWQMSHPDCETRVFGVTPLIGYSLKTEAAMQIRHIGAKLGSVMVLSLSL